MLRAEAKAAKAEAAFAVKVYNEAVAGRSEAEEQLAATNSTVTDL
jgi:hypothetical protein